jgi:hypothetical protein
MGSDFQWRADLVRRTGALPDVDQTDQNVRFQQNLTHRRISMVVLGSNIWPSVRQKVAEITLAVAGASPGSFEFIEIAPPPKRRRLSGPPI